MTLTLGMRIGPAKVVSFLEEPNTGLAQIEENGHTFTVPCWLLEMAAESIIIDECQIKYCGETHCTSEVRDRQDRWRKLCEAHVAMYRGTHRDDKSRRIASNRLKAY